jgi:hypothetical protein
MDVSARDRVQHALRNALTKISIPLQMLKQQTPLSEQHRQLVNTALQGVADLDRILRDDVEHRLSGQPPLPGNN